MSENPLEELLSEAGRRKWCTRRFCTTCGATEFLNGLRRMVGQDGALLADALAAMDLSAWYDVPDFGGALRLTFDALPWPFLVDDVVSAWLPRVHGHVRVIDAVLFHLVREGRLDDQLRAQWIGVAESAAIESGDPSLLESLVYALRERMLEYPELMRVAQRARRGHSPLHRAMAKLPGIGGTGA
jgi:hypothetical protein